MPCKSHYTISWFNITEMQQIEGGFKNGKNGKKLWLSCFHRTQGFLHAESRNHPNYQNSPTQALIVTDTEPKDLVYPEGWYYAKGSFRNKHMSSTGIYSEVLMMKSDGSFWGDEAKYCTLDSWGHFTCIALIAMQVFLLFFLEFLSICCIICLVFICACSSTG